MKTLVRAQVELVWEELLTDLGCWQEIAHERQVGYLHHIVDSADIEGVMLSVMEHIDVLATDDDGGGYGIVEAGCHKIDQWWVRYDDYETYRRIVAHTTYRFWIVDDAFVPETYPEGKAALTVAWWWD